MSKRKGRRIAPKIPTPNAPKPNAPKASTEPPLRNGEKRVPVTARMLLKQLEDAYVQQRQELLNVIAADLGFKPGQPVAIDFARWAIGPVAPDAPSPAP
jgi:hypothetical protein